MHFKIWLLGENEDFVVSRDIQINIGRAALSIDARDGEVIDIGGLCAADHGQVNHSICRTRQCVLTMYESYLRHKELDLATREEFKHQEITLLCSKQIA